MLPEPARQHLEALAASDDALDAQVAERLNGQAAPHAQRKGTAGYRPSRWTHVPLGELFAEQGNTLDDRGETIKTGHEPVHGSRSGTCVVIWPAQGRWSCSSCRQAGDAATYIMGVEGVDYQRAAALLRGRFGPPTDALPEIVARGRQLRDISRDALDALLAANDPPRLFVRERELVRLVPSADTPDRLLVEPLSEPEVCNELTLAADFVVVKIGRKGEGKMRVAVPPPSEVVQDVRAQSSWDFPVLRGVVDRPTLRRDGSLLTAPGYDRQSGLYLNSAPGLRVPSVADTPSADDVARARALLDQPLADFPLVSAADTATALGLGLQPFVRELIDGPTPLHLIEAPTPGSGKGLLADALLHPSCGAQHSLLSQARDDDEWRKRLLAVLREERPAVQIDNVNRPLDSSALCSVLTAYPTWSDRLLGSNVTLDVLVRCTWLATANNPTLSMEMARRTVRCRLDPHVDRPWEREAFRIPRLLEWVAARRGELIWAYLVLARSWVAAGRPPWRGRALGSFERWSDVIGGILQHVGIDGFLGNLDEFYETADLETAVWRAFVLAWWDKHHGQEVGTADVFPIALETEGLDLGNGQERSQKIKFGKMLTLQRDRVIAGYRVTYGGKQHNSARWQLLPTENRPAGQSGDVGDDGGCSDPSPARAPACAHAHEDDAETSPHIPNIPQPGHDGAVGEPRGQSAEPDGEGRGSHPALVVVMDDAEWKDTLPSLLAADVLGLDTETTGLDPRADRLRLVQLAASDATYVVDVAQVDAQLLAPLFDPTNGPILIGHNLQFDLQFLAGAGLPIPNGCRLFDTMIAAQLLEARAERFPPGHHTLQQVAGRYLGEQLDKELQRSDWSGPLADEQLRYAAHDAAVLPKLHAVMAECLRRDDLERVMCLEMRALPAVVWLERSGAPFDAEAWTALAEAAVRRQLEIEQRLVDEAGPLALRDGKPVNWGSTRQVQEVLAARGNPVTNTREDVLAALSETEPLAALMLKFREAVKRVGTYGLKYIQEHVHPATLRIHPDWHQLGALSGRMSCSRPNLQQVPRDQAYRACVRPGDGRVLVKADYSQIELRIVAEIAHDERLLAAFADGLDVHTLTAAEVLGRRDGEVTPADRQAAKALNFGLTFGMGATRLREYAAQSFGVALSLAEADAFRTRFFDAYQGLRAWHRQQPRWDRPIDTRTPAGRRRLGVTKFTEQLNSPIQGAGADGIKASLALLWETRDTCPSAEPILAVHDEIVIECDQADAERAKAWLTDCMTRGMQSVLKQVPVVVEPTVERDWSGTPLHGEDAEEAR